MMTATMEDYLPHGGGVWGERYRLGQDRADVKSAKTGTDYVACIHCGNVLPAAKAIWVELVDPDDLVEQTPEARELAQHDGGYMGCWPVGSTCGKTIPAQYRVTRKGGA